jgi:hypothetical protein
MFDCNLIKSRDQKMHDYQLPELESTYHIMQMPMPIPAPLLPITPKAPSRPSAPVPSPLMPSTPPTPARPQTPTSPTLPSGTPEAEEVFPLNPLLPRFLPTSSTLTVPANPILPAQYATTLDYESLQYLNGYLRTQIGKYVEAQFLVGSNNISTMFGRLAGVGLNYILIEDLATGDVSACDFYNIKFFRTHAHGDVKHQRQPE